MKYVGIATQQARNNVYSLLLLSTFPMMVAALTWVFLGFLSYVGGQDEMGRQAMDWEFFFGSALLVTPCVFLVIGVWFLIAYFWNTSMIRRATGARPLERRENPRVYNIVENLTMACGMNMPKINVIDSPELNAFASGVDERSYTVTVTTGICERLDDDELAGVIGHELTHIRNRDTRLLIICIVFVGIMSTLTTILFRVVWNLFVYGGSGRSRRSSNGKGGGGVAVLVIILVAAVLCGVGYCFALCTRFAISRKREYMADAGGAELCGNPLALASALRKISANPLPANGREDVAQLFIIHPKDIANGFARFFDGLFSTHPSTESRIAYLEQF